MQIEELMQELVAMYPNQLGKPATALAWKRQYLQVLGAVQGPRLERAWLACNGSWDKASFPRPGEIAKYLRSSSPGVGREYDLTWTDRRQTDKWRDLQREIEQEFLAQLVKGYGNPDATGPIAHGRNLPPAYAAENAWSFRLLPWNQEKIDGLTDYIIAHQSTDWFELLPKILPTRKDVENAKRTEAGWRMARAPKGFKGLDPSLSILDAG